MCVGEPSFSALFYLFKWMKVLNAFTPCKPQSSKGYSLVKRFIKSLYPVCFLFKIFWYWKEMVASCPGEHEETSLERITSSFL